MNAPTRVFLLAAFAYFSFAAVARVDAAAKPDVDGIQGTWEIEEGTVSGKPAPEGMRKALKFTFKGDMLTLAGGPTNVEYTFTLDTKASPRTITVSPSEGPQKGKMIVGIYELKADKMRLCLPNTEKAAAPTEFKSAEGSQLGLFTLKRAAAK